MIALCNSCDSVWIDGKKNCHRKSCVCGQYHMAPTQEEIAAACLKIQDTWSDYEKVKRAAWAHTAPVDMYGTLGTRRGGRVYNSVERD